MRKSVRFLVSIPDSIANRITDPKRAPAERGAILAELLSPGGGRWYAARVRRPGFRTVGVLVTAPEQAVQFLVMAGDNSKYRRTIIRGLAAFDAWTFIRADIAPVDAPPAAIEPVKLADFEAARASRDELLDEFPPDARVILEVTAEGIAV